MGTYVACSAITIVFILAVSGIKIAGKLFPKWEWIQNTTKVFKI